MRILLINMVSPRDVDQEKLVQAVSEQLKSRMEMPEWALYIKTGMHKDRPPEGNDWWHMRSASILRNVYLNGPVGTQRLRSYYGGRHRRGHKPSHFAKASGKIIRTILNDLEKSGLLKKNEKPRGRVVTPEGEKLLAQTAKKIGVIA